MGVELVKAASVHGADLPGVPFKVLVRMSLQALDPGSPSNGRPDAVYWGGWRPLALAIGADPDARKAQELVRRAVKRLVAEGHVTPMIDRANRGTRQVYRLNLIA